MIQRQDDDGASAILHLPKIMDLPAASLLATNLLALRGSHLTLEGSSVEHLGAQCVQVLVSAHLTWAREGLVVSLVNPSQAFLETLTVLGIPIGRIGEWEAIQ